MKDTSGSAYPWGIPKGVRPSDGENTTGMPLRDYFAGQALIGFNRPDVRKKYALYIESEKIADSIAKVCYEQADAMIRESKK